MLALLLLPALTRADDFCPGSYTIPKSPQWPEDDSSIVNPRGGDRIVTRETNSELVDLGHPGAYRTKPKKDCPYDDTDVVHWSNVLNPKAYEDVELPKGKKVLISRCSVDQPLGQIKIPPNSQLIFADQPIHLNVTGIEVLGKLKIGSEKCRLRSWQSITLRGSRPEDNVKGAEPQKKGIYVKGGTLDIHSVEYYHTWSRLAVTAKPGDTYLLIQDQVNWDIGSRFFLTGTQLKDSRDWHQNEIFTVTAVKKATGLPGETYALYLDHPVEFTHFGGDAYQAEVGLLTRRFKIQGSEFDSEPTDKQKIGCTSNKYASFPCPESYLTGYGGHVMMETPQAVGRVEGVEFYRMGQTNFEGRYPIHWHLVQDAGEGQYVRDSSFHRSFYKCVTIHGTNKVLASRNTAYDVIGHCLYLEDGVEEENEIEYNLHAFVHPIGMPPGNGGTGQNLPQIQSSKDLTTASDSAEIKFKFRYSAT